MKTALQAVRIGLGALALATGVAVQAAAPVITDITMVGGIFIDDVAVLNNSKLVMADDFNTGELTAWTAPQPRVVVTPVMTNSANYCLYMNRENGNKTYARHSVQCDDVGALEVKAKVFLPPPAEQWGYSHGKRERTSIGLTTGRDEHRFNVEIAISPGELAYHVELVQIKMEIKEPRDRSETYASREHAIAPGKWALVSFKLDPSAGTATVYVDGQLQVSCPYDSSKITKLNELYLTTFMGNLEPAGKNAAVPGLAKKSSARMGNLEPTVNAAGETNALAGSPAAPESLRFKELLSRLSAASEDRIRGLSTIQCDYRLMGTDSSEEPAAGKKPPVKLAVSGKLTIHLPEDRADWDNDNPPGTFDTFRLEPDAWPVLTDALGEFAAEKLKPFPMPGSKLICSEGGSWLVSKDDKTAVRFKMDSAGQDLVFGPIVPTVCCHYEAIMVKAFRAEFRGSLSANAEPVSLAGRKCARYLFKLPKEKGTGGAPGGTYAVWLDDATGLPLQEQQRGGLAAAGGEGRTTYSDLQPFGKGSFSPAVSKWMAMDDRGTLRYAQFGTNWFLTTEITVNSGEGSCTMTFSNWRQVTAPNSAFKLPPGAKVISWEATADKGRRSKE